MTRTTRTKLVLLAVLPSDSRAVAQTYNVPLIVESSEGRDVAKAVAARLRTIRRYALTDEF